MKRLICISVMSFIIVLIQGCSSVPVDLDSKVRVVSSESSYLSNCKLLGSITAQTEASIFLPFDDLVQRMKNDLKIRSRSEYPSADTIGMDDFSPNPWAGRPDSTVNGVAFKCFD
jgi:hypothetical protein